MKKWYFEIIIFVCLLIGLMLFKNKISGNNLVGVYVDNIESSLLPDKDNYVIDKVVCDNEAVGTWDNANWNLLITNLSKKSNCKLYFRSKKEITVTYDNNFVKKAKFMNSLFDFLSTFLFVPLLLGVALPKLNEKTVKKMVQEEQNTLNNSSNRQALSVKA